MVFPLYRLHAKLASGGEGNADRQRERPEFCKEHSIKTAKHQNQYFAISYYFTKLQTLIPTGNGWGKLFVDEMRKEMLRCSGIENKTNCPILQGGDKENTQKGRASAL